MADGTKIEWCDGTFNPWIGCTRVSTEEHGGGGCDGCYAAVSTPARVLRAGGAETWGPGAPRHRTSAANWNQPLQWERAHDAFFATHGRRRRVFCASLADVFDNEVDPAWRADLFALIAATPNLDWLLLTKRIGNAARMIDDTLDELALQVNSRAMPWPPVWPWPNVWLMATMVNQPEYDRDIGKLLRTPAVVHGISVEPMLGAMDLRLGGASMPDYAEARPLARLDWVIVGGESGPHARPAHPDWFRSLRDQCMSAGVPFLLKQHGEWIERDTGSATPLVARDGDPEFAHAARQHDAFISLDGHVIDDIDFARIDVPYRGLVRVGKKSAGRLLDGVEHNEFPRRVEAPTS